jgi:3-oxoacyl-[acyl-carrier-protein] synthase II
MKRRAVITGMGVISPLGIGADANREALKSGQSGISEITTFDGSLLPLKAAGQVRDFHPEDYITNSKSIKLMSRCSQMAVAVAGMAVADSGIDLGSVDPSRIGIYMGLGMASGDLEEITPMLLSSLDHEGGFSPKRFGSEGLSSLNPILSFKVLNNFPLCHTAIEFNIQGPNLTFNSFAPGAAQAVGEAFRAIQYGQVDLAFAGGADSQVSVPGFITLSQMGLLARSDKSPEELSRPFDVGRNGLVPGEGAAFIVLEAMGHALARKAHIHAEIIGYGQAACNTAYGYNMDTTGRVLAMQKALSDSGIKPSDVGYINASADSHPIGDLAEARAIAEVFSDSVTISSTKSMTGNLLAAAEPFELFACAGVLEESIIPPTLNFAEPDPGVELNIVASAGQERAVEIAMSNSFGFCGSCVSLVLGTINRCNRGWS